MWLFSLEVLISFLNTSYDFVIVLFKKVYCQNNLISYPHAQKLIVKQTYNVKMEPGKNRVRYWSFSIIFNIICHLSIMMRILKVQA